MKENKSTPAIIKKEGEKTIYKCGKNAQNKEKDSKKENKQEVDNNG